MTLDTHIEKLNIDLLQSLAKNKKIVYVETDKKLQKKLHDSLSVFQVQTTILNNFEELQSYLTKDFVEILIINIDLLRNNHETLLSQLESKKHPCNIIVSCEKDDVDFLKGNAFFSDYKRLKKPYSEKNIIQVLIDELIDIQTSFTNEEDTELLSQVFHSQKNMILLVEKGEPKLANKKFFRFFHILMHDYSEIILSIEKRLIPKENFIYSDDESTWLAKILLSKDDTFNMLFKRHDYYHFMISKSVIPDSSRVILSFDDITSYGLESLFIANQSFQEEKAELDRFLKMLRVKQHKTKMQNMYKGIQITQNALVLDVDQDKYTFKVHPMQLTSIKAQETTIIKSDTYPKGIKCDYVLNIDEKKSIVTFKSCSPVQNTSTQRKLARVHVSEFQESSYEFKKHNLDASIYDISLSAIKISSFVRPAGIDIGSEIILHSILDVRKNIQISVKGKIFRIDETPDAYFFVIIYESNQEIKKTITQYMLNRQSEIIREIKSHKDP